MRPSRSAGLSFRLLPTRLRSPPPRNLGSQTPQPLGCRALRRAPPKRRRRWVGARAPAQASRQTCSDGRSGVQVSINETVPSLIGQLLSAPSMQVGVVAVARVAGSSRLCMVGLNPKDPETISLNKQATLTANGCTVYSNSKAADGIKAPG